MVNKFYFGLLLLISCTKIPDGGIQINEGLVDSTSIVGEIEPLISLSDYNTPKMEEVIEIEEEVNIPVVEAGITKSKERVVTKKIKVKKTKNQVTLDYIKRFKDLAKQSERETGIPAAIHMAQGIVESGSGTTSLAKEANNHFGIKNVEGGESFLIYDDNWVYKGKVYHQKESPHPTAVKKKCKFKIYNSAWESWKDHSRFLMRSRYSKVKSKSYITAAKELKKAGYATDKNYANKLIGIIERYDLNNL